MGSYFMALEQLNYNMLLRHGNHVDYKYSFYTKYIPIVLKLCCYIFAIKYYDSLKLPAIEVNLSKHTTGAKPWTNSLQWQEA